MEFQVLGPLEVRADGRPYVLGAPRQRAVLAVLLLNANRVVPAGRLVDAVWGTEPPATASVQVQAVVSALRRLLPRDELIVTRSPGYLIRVEDTELDLTLFERRVAEAARAASDGHLERAAERFQAALALWRGPALADVPGPVAHAEAVRLGERRLAVLEQRIDAELVLGRHAELVSELSALVDENRLRERLCAQLMLALYRSGRQADALAAYQDTYQVLSAELGLEPGGELQRLQQAILTADPALDLPATTGVSRRRGRNDLPRDLADFTGRDKEIGQLLARGPAEEEAAPAVAAIDGMAGVGKTALAVHIAHLLLERYPDGQLFLDLRGHHPTRDPVEPATALDTLLRALGIPAEEIPHEPDERAARWRAELAMRRTLVVLDDARDAAQVRPLLPGAANCLMLVTSRRRLIGLDAQSLSLDMLPEADAVGLLEREIGADRVATEPDATLRIVAACGQLPLAIRVAAARLRHRPSWSIGHLVERLDDQHRRLAELSAEDITVAATVGLSYDQLSDPQQRTYRLVGLHPGTEIDVAAAAALTGRRSADAERVLEDLVDVHLLEIPSQGRYRMHALVHDHARPMTAEVDGPGERSAAMERVLGYYIHATIGAVRTLAPAQPHVDFPLPPAPAEPIPFAGADEGLRWLEAERSTLVAAVEAAADAGLVTHCWQLAYAMWWFCYTRGYLDDWERVDTVALEATERDGDLLGAAMAGNGLGVVATHRGDHDGAVRRFRAALGAYRGLGDERGTGVTLCNIGERLIRLGRYAEAYDRFDEALRLLRAVGDRSAEVTTLIGLGEVLWRLHRHTEAVQSLERAVTLARDIGSAHLGASARCGLGRLHSERGEFDRARRYLERALTMGRHAASPCVEANVLSSLGNLERDSGRPQAALRHHRAALDRAAGVGDVGWLAEAHNDYAASLMAAGHHAHAREEHKLAYKLAVRAQSAREKARAIDGLTGKLT